VLLAEDGDGGAGIVRVASSFGHVLVVGFLPGSWRRAADLGAQILAVLGSLSRLCLLRWRELERRRGITVSLNKKVAAGHLLALGCEAPLFFLAGRGGEEEGWWSAIDPGPLEPLAGHGGEERRSSPWVTLAFSGGLGPPVEVPLNKRVLRVLLQPHLLRLPPPIRGRIGESEGGQLCIVGVAEESSAARCFFSSSFSPPSCAEVVKDGGVDWVSRSAIQQWSWEAIFLSITSVRHPRPNHGLSNSRRRAPANTQPPL
jgi:hypothetical protein